MQRPAPGSQAGPLVSLGGVLADRPACVSRARRLREHWPFRLPARTLSMVSRSILSHWLLLRRTVTAANAIAVGALLIASASPGAATAATVRVQPAWYYPLQ